MDEGAGRVISSPVIRVYTTPEDLPALEKQLKKTLGTSSSPLVFNLLKERTLQQETDRWESPEVSPQATPFLWKKIKQLSPSAFLPQSTWAGSTWLGSVLPEWWVTWTQGNTFEFKPVHRVPTLDAQSIIGHKLPETVLSNHVLVLAERDHDPWLKSSYGTIRRSTWIANLVRAAQFHQRIHRIPLWLLVFVSLFLFVMVVRRKHGFEQAMCFGFIMLFEALLAPFHLHLGIGYLAMAFGGAWLFLGLEHALMRETVAVQKAKTQIEARAVLAELVSPWPTIVALHQKHGSTPSLPIIGQHWVAPHQTVPENNGVLSKLNVLTPELSQWAHATHTPFHEPKELNLFHTLSLLKRAPQWTPASRLHPEGQSVITPVFPLRPDTHLGATETLGYWQCHYSTKALAQNTQLLEEKKETLHRLSKWIASGAYHAHLLRALDETWTQAQFEKAYARYTQRMKLIKSVERTMPSPTAFADGTALVIAKNQTMELITKGMDRNQHLISILSEMTGLSYDKGSQIFYEALLGNKAKYPLLPQFTEQRLPMHQGLVCELDATLPSGDAYGHVTLHVPLPSSSGTPSQSVNACLEAIFQELLDSGACATHQKLFIRAASHPIEETRMQSMRPAITFLLTLLFKHTKHLSVETEISDGLLKVVFHVSLPQAEQDHLKATFVRESFAPALFVTDAAVDLVEG